MRSRAATARAALGRIALRALPAVLAVAAAGCLAEPPGHLPSSIRVLYTKTARDSLGERVDVWFLLAREGNELRLTETIAPGQVFVPFHFAEWNANQVTQSAFDPISREPNYKQSAVRVERTLR